MDLSVNRDTVRINKLVFEGTADHPIESDVLLPDYCPDIARILSTDASANIDSESLDTGKFDVSGTFRVRIIYVPDNSGTIRCFNYESAFNHTFEGAGIDNNDSAMVKAKVDYVNCRPISPRRLQIKASVSIPAKIFSQKEEEIITGCDDDKVEVLSRPVKMSVPVGCARRPFSIEDELEVSYGKPAIASVVRYDATAIVQECKVIANKIITKGQLLLHTLYVPEDEKGGLEVMDHSIPLSQIIDLAGVAESSRVSVTYEVLKVSVEAAANSDGENRIIAVKADINASAAARNDGEFTAVADAYSPVYEMDIEVRPLFVECIKEIIKTNETVKFTVEAPGDGISGIADCVVKPETATAKADGKNLVVSGEMNISAMASDMQGGPVCITKTMPYTVKEPMASDGGNIRCDPEIKVSAVTFGNSPSGIDVRCDCVLSAVVFGAENQNVVSEMVLDETKPRKISQKSLTLYFADSGESVWNIAKKYNTSMDAIKRENNIETDTLPERSMLLIPKKHCRKKC